MHRTRWRQRELQRLLGAGLADAAGHGDDAHLLYARTGGGAEIVQRGKRVGHAQQPRLAALALMGLLDDCARGAMRERRPDEEMAVAVEAAQRQESLAGREAPAVDGDTADRRA